MTFKNSIISRYELRAAKPIKITQALEFDDFVEVSEAEKFLDAGDLEIEVDVEGYVSKAYSGSRDQPKSSSSVEDISVTYTEKGKKIDIAWETLTKSMQQNIEEKLLEVAHDPGGGD